MNKISPVDLEQFYTVFTLYRSTTTWFFSYMDPRWTLVEVFQLRQKVAVSAVDQRDQNQVDYTYNATYRFISTAA